MTTVPHEQLRRFIPLSGLSADNFNDIAKKISIETLPAGTKIFNLGESDYLSYYLVSGEVEIIDANGKFSSLSSESDKSHFPLEHNQPRQKTVISKTNIKYFKIENSVLDTAITWDQNKNYIVHNVTEEETDTGDWMTHILQLDIFHKIPPANIQAMFKKFEAIQVKKDQVIISQGEAGDYYYIIHQGNCRVIYKGKETANKEVKIADLKEGTSFGEDALTSDTPRNATVIMNSDGVLIRLSKEDFNALLKSPVIKSVSFEEAEEMVAKGAIWIDVRFIEEHKNNPIPGSLNIPLYLLRLNTKKLPQQKKYIIYCDTGSRSASATYILNEKGLDAYLLEGGLTQNQNTNDAA